MRLVALASLVAFVALQQGARACPPPPPEMARTSSPADGDANVPTSVRPRVIYATGALAQAQCGTAPPAPTIRHAAPHVDGGVPGSSPPGTWVRITDLDPATAVGWEFRPSAPLDVAGVYELVDAYPAVCSCQAGPCMPGTPQAFATFTTGTGPDTTKPTFSGLQATKCFHQECSTATGVDCCPASYNFLELDFLAALDAADDVSLGLTSPIEQQSPPGVHLYVRPDGGQYDFTKPLAPLRVTDPSTGAVEARWAVTLPPGKYFALARAFDTSGNEDGNMNELPFTLPLASETKCAGVLDGGVGDLGPGAPDLLGSAFDYAPASDLSAPAGSSSGCGCSIGRRTPSTGSTRWALLLGTVLSLVPLLRRRKRQKVRTVPKMR